MDFPLKQLGTSLGLLLSNWQAGGGKATIAEMTGALDIPRDEKGFLYVGSVQISSLPPDALHDLLEFRNQHVAGLIREYCDLMGQYSFSKDTYDLLAFRQQIKYPQLDETIYDQEGKNRPYNKSWRAAMLSKYGLTNYGKNNLVYGQISYDSIAGAFLLPDYNFYAKHLETDKNSHRKAAPKNAGGLLEWKNYLLAQDEVITRFFFRSITSYVPLKAFDRHAYIVGASGSGKSELIKLILHSLIRSKFTQETSAVIIDPHGDLAEEIARFRECENNERIIYFDPENSKYHTPCLNIFSLPDDDEKTVDIVAANIADAFEEIIADASISAQMRALLIPCISVLLRRPNSSISDLQRFMVEDENWDLLELGKNSPNAGQAQFFRTKFETKTYAPTKASIYTRLQTLLNSTQFRRMLNPKATLDLEAELNKGKIVIFNLSKSAIGADVSGAMGRFIVAQIKNLGFRRQALAKSKRVPTYVFIDECQNFIGESIETTLTELRKYGVHMILANQVLGQNMSSQLEKIILANTAVKFAGKNGESTQQKMAKEMYADIEDLRSLTVGRFACKVDIPNRITHPFIFHAPTHLIGTRNAMRGETWLAQRKRSWKGYVANSELDTTPQSHEEAREDHLRVQRPDFVEEVSEGVKGPRFDF